MAARVGEAPTRPGDDVTTLGETVAVERLVVFVRGGVDDWVAIVSPVVDDTVDRSPIRLVDFDRRS